MALNPWEIQLFKEYNLVALGPFHNKVKLFDVLIKREKLGNHPKLFNIGSLLNLQKSDANTSSDFDANTCSEWKDVSDKINNYLKGELRMKDEKGLVDKDERGSFKCTTNYASGVLFSLLKLFHIDGRRSKMFSITAYQVNSEAIDNDVKISLFDEQEGWWVPNLEKIQRQKPLLRKNGNIELWVVTQMNYCTEMIIESVGQTSTDGSLSLPDVVTDIIGSVVPIDGKIKISKSNKGSFVVKGENGKNVPIGFKAIKLEYGPNGKLKNLNDSGGDITPSYRADVDDDDDAFDPDKDSKHMADLFLYEGEERVACLEIE